MLDDSRETKKTRPAHSRKSAFGKLTVVDNKPRLTGSLLAQAESANFLQELIEYAPAVMFCHDIEHNDNCLFVSKAFEDIWGMPRSALQTNPRAWSDSIIPEDREFVEQRFHENLEMGKAQEFEYRIRNTRNELRYIHARFINLPNAYGQGAHRIGFASDITDRRLAELEAYAMAHKDEVTGVASRQAYSRTLAEMLSSRDIGGNEEKLVAVFLDIDRFGKINDTLGHSVGDEYLRKVAERIKAFIGTRGYVARFGGDEFALILTDCDELASTHSRLIGLQQALTQPISVDGEQIVTTASMGAACYPVDGDDPGSLMRAAELAMVRSKTRRRGSLTFYKPELTSKSTRDRLRRDMDLRKALSRKQFELFYQGKFHSTSRQLAGAEVLLRWRHPVHGLVSPAEFIPQLEDSGDILEVGHWILDAACEQLAIWQKQSSLPTGFSLAINVSAAQFLSTGFVEDVQETMNRHQVPASAIELELTESAILADPGRAELVFDQLREAGLRIAIDDFGTGYSSMSYLRRFRPNVLKIDRSFTLGCDTDETSLGIVESIIQLGRTLGMTIVAEGIETTPQADSLGRAGSDLLQGFLLSKPAPRDQFEALLAPRGTLPEMP